LTTFELCEKFLQKISPPKAAELTAYVQEKEAQGLRKGYIVAKLGTPKDKDRENRKSKKPLRRTCK
jgi:hypothetical protein